VGPVRQRNKRKEKEPGSVGCRGEKFGGPLGLKEGKLSFFSFLFQTLFKTTFKLNFKSNFFKLFTEFL
jgi:hypothetical protein